MAHLLPPLVGGVVLPLAGGEGVVGELVEGEAVVHAGTENQTICQKQPHVVIEEQLVAPMAGGVGQLVAPLAGGVVPGGEVTSTEVCQTQVS